MAIKNIIVNVDRLFDQEENMSPPNKILATIPYDDSVPTNKAQALAQANQMKGKYISQLASNGVEVNFNVTVIES